MKSGSSSSRPSDPRLREPLLSHGSPKHSEEVVLVENKNNNVIEPSMLEQGVKSMIGDTIRGIGHIRMELSGQKIAHLPEDRENAKVTLAGDVSGPPSNVSGEHLSISVAGSETNASEETNIFKQIGRSISGRAGSRGSQRVSGRLHPDPGDVFPISEELLDPFKLSAATPDVSLTAAKYPEREEKKELPSAFRISYYINLAAFGILGVLTRYVLQKLFGPDGAGLTSDGTILYLDLPSNVIGSFLMGWLGVVFKDNISAFSDPFAVGLSTGYLGSLTTFSGWNQKMLELSSTGHWLFAVLGFLFGLLCSYGSLVFGVDTAKAFKWLLSRIGKGRNNSGEVNSYRRELAILLVVLLTLAGLWTTSGIMEKREYKNGGGGAQLWLACFVGPLGVWIRWWLSRLNGRGLGSSGQWKWFPFGTLIANVSAACVMAALAIVKKAVNTKDCDTIATGVQMGLMGCLSTVSTFMSEFYKLKKDERHAWRAYAYAALTIVISFSLGILIYSVPMWTKGYK